VDVEVRLQGTVEEAIERMRTYLTNSGFGFMEADRAYSLVRGGAEARRTHTRSTFWARRQLAAPNAQTHAVEVVGEILLEEQLVLIRAHFVELHGQREHVFGGSHVLEACVNEFCEVWGVWAA
jgi:hypothetical protein